MSILISPSNVDESGLAVCLVSALFASEELFSGVVSEKVLSPCSCWMNWIACCKPAMNFSKSSL